MTPQQFVDEVTPHLPIGPYTEVDIEWPESLGVRLWTGKGYDHLIPISAARLLLGATVEECFAFTTAIGIGASAGCDGKAMGMSDGTDIFAKLRAALRDRAAANAVADRRGA